MRILVVEDDKALSAQLRKSLEREGYVVDAAADGEEGLYAATELPVDLAVVDLGLPMMSGLDVIRKARAKGVKFPILILTARHRWQDKVEGLEAGADDYVVKPFEPNELLARVRALLRRSGGWATSVLASGPICLSPAEKAVTVNGKLVTLTAYEFRVLEHLMLNIGKVVSKAELEEHAYSEDESRDSNVIEVFIRRIRNKIDPSETLNPVETLRGQGYRFRNLSREKQ